MTAFSRLFPAYPLIAHDPYFSIWSCVDRSTDDFTRHWTGTPQMLTGFLRIDGKAYGFLGRITQQPVLTQVSLQVLPTRTIYTFEEAGVRFVLSFITPLLPHKLNVLARPVTYIDFAAESIDGKNHALSVCFDVDAAVCVNEIEDKVIWGRLRHRDLDLLGCGAADQRVLGRIGDRIRIDWGYFYLGVPRDLKAGTAINSSTVLRRSFIDSGEFVCEDSLAMPTTRKYDAITLAAKFDLAAVPGKVSSAYLIAAYNDIFSIEYLNRRLRGYWTTETDSFAEMLSLAVREYPALREECARFDAELLADAEAVGGSKYADLCAVSYRQAVAAHKLVADADGTPLFFSKENLSNGCIATVDVTYPSTPLFFLCQPLLVKGMLIPMLEYASSRRWRFPFAPHDLGTYPLANGQVYGGGERTEENQMPVEECGNMLILAAALVKFTDDLDFARKYWAKLSQWADYLLDKGYDPENQLCTDDFAGHLAHNTNLSIKAIVALGGFAQTAERLGETAVAEKFSRAAHDFARRWVADADDGKWYRLAFDQPGSWSQKYNLVWDCLLGLGLFPPEVAKKELAHYREVQQKFGLPLDSRKSYTKLDWILWTATLTGDADDFRALLEPVHRWLAEGASRVPLTDWYETTGDGRQMSFQARSVVGGVFIKLLADEALRRKWLAKLR